MKKINKNYIFILIGVIIFTGAIFIIGALNLNKSNSQAQSANLEELNENIKEENSDFSKNQNQIVEVSPNTIDLGTVIYGEVPTAKFTLTNYTSNSLKITRVSTSCECTSAKVERDTLSPNESTEINVSFNPAVHGDDTDVGELTRSIYLETDNPN